MIQLKAYLIQYFINTSNKYILCSIQYCRWPCDVLGAVDYVIDKG